MPDLTQRVAHGIVRVLTLPVALAVGAVGLQVMSSIEDGIKSMNLSVRIHEAEKNHALFEGTWTPHEVALAVYEREMDEWDEKLENHAEIEGAHLQVAA